MIINPSFEDPEGEWLTLPGGNQQPTGWLLEWDPVGTLMKAPSAGAGDAVQVVNCVPECVHKLSRQLPADEQLGGKDALILDGNATYKIFGPDSFRVTLKQTISNNKRIKYAITVPVQVHGHLDENGVPWNIDTGAAYWRLIIDGEGYPWLTFNNEFQDREWCEVYLAEIPIEGHIDVAIEFECHTLGGVSFFIDNVRDSVQDYVPVEPECSKPRDGWTHRVSVLVREDAPMDVWLAACEWAGHPDRKHDVTQSWDHAFYGPGLEEVEIILWYDKPNAFDYDEVMVWGTDYYEDVNWSLMAVDDYDPDPEPPPIDPPPVDPPPGFTPINYVPTGCKTSFHGIGDDGITSFQQALMERGASLPTAKAVQDIGWLEHIKLTDDQTRTVARFIDDGQGSGSLEGFDSTKDYTWQAEKRMYELMPLWSQHRGYVDFWEIVNEQDPVGAEGHTKIALYFIRAMEIAELWGYKLAIFSYSMGVPEPHEWDAIAQTGVFERAAQGGHAISLHEYGEWPRDQISLLTRYRYVYENHILPRGLDIPLFITEAGAHGFDPSEYTDAQMIEQMIAYDREVAKDPYVAGVHLFTVGGFGSWPQYRDRWVELYPQFVDYAVSVKDRANG